MKQKMKWGEEPELSGPRDYFRNTLLLNEVEKYKKGTKILDFGAGSGHLLIRLIEKGNNCLAMDVSKLAIIALQKKISAKNRKRNGIQAGNIYSLFKLKQKFDVVVSGEVLEHIKDDEEAVKGFYKVLNKNGICVVSVPANMKLWDLNDDFSGHYRRYSKNELIKIFQKNKFKVIKIYTWGFPLTLIWHRMIYLRLINIKITSGKKYSGSSTFFGKLLRMEWFKRKLSIIFWFDQLFNWTGFG